VCIIPIKETARVYAGEVAAKLASEGVRVEIDDRNETLNKRIRNAEMAKIPYVLVIGDREAADGRVAVRKRREGDKGAMPAEQFLQKVTREIIDRAL
jgi:threonyl-tRNA synthetase